MFIVRVLVVRVLVGRKDALLPCASCRINLLLMFQNHFLFILSLSNSVDTASVVFQ